MSDKTVYVTTAPYAQEIQCPSCESETPVLINSERIAGVSCDHCGEMIRFRFERETESTADETEQTTLMTDGGKPEVEDDTDPLRHAAVGETIKVEESRVLHAINYEPDEFYGVDRERKDIRISDLEVIETDTGEDIRITWEGEVTKTLPPRWDYRDEPVTDSEKARERRQKWISRGLTTLGLVVPLVVSTFVASTLMNALDGQMTINGDPFTAPPTFVPVLVVAMLVFLAWVVQWAAKGGIPPGRVYR